MTTLVLGNGFDLDLGWKTSYTKIFEHRKRKYNSYNGDKYVRLLLEQYIEKNWCDLEGFIREQICSLSHSCKIDEDIDALMGFKLITDGCLYDYFTVSDGKYYSKDYNQNSLASHILTRFTHFDKIYSFNYTNPIKQLLVKDSNISHVHNERKNQSLILGTDKRILDELSGLDEEKRNQIEKAFVKTSQCGYKPTEFNSDLFKSDTIVIFGHSFGICDSDYFYPFFTQIINNETHCKDLYIITKDEDSLCSIKQNMMLYNINYDDLKLSNTKVHIILNSGDWERNDEYLSLDRIIEG